MRCPLCRQETTWQDNPWRPFCSELCQMIDLGHWVSENYRIAQPEDAAQTASPRGEEERDLNHEQR
jgi:endogenous inhibitor of DNA gyrase (YacG/DUF329 family)